jgi:hypothetical protein
MFMERSPELTNETPCFSAVFYGKIPPQSYIFINQTISLKTADPSSDKHVAFDTHTN